MYNQIQLVKHICLLTDVWKNVPLAFGFLLMQKQYAVPAPMATRATAMLIVPARCEWRESILFQIELQLSNLQQRLEKKERKMDRLVHTSNICVCLSLYTLKLYQVATCRQWYRLQLIFITQQNYQHRELPIFRFYHQVKLYKICFEKYENNNNKIKNITTTFFKKQLYVTIRDVNSVSGPGSLNTIQTIQHRRLDIVYQTVLRG